MCLSLLETKRQRDARLLLWVQDAQRLGDQVLECRDARGQISHSVVLAAAAATGYQHVTTAVQQTRPWQDAREIQAALAREHDALEHEATPLARLLPVSGAALPSGICSARLAPRPRRGLA
ncbi:MAG: hypothetical protein ABIJ09_04305 [Pseudomonadota bacterium]